MCPPLSATSGQWWNSRHSSISKPGFSFRTGIRQPAPVLPLFPGSPTIRLQICVTLTQLCCERWCSSSLLGVSDKSVGLVFAKGSHLMPFFVSIVKSSVNSSVWPGLFLQTFLSLWPLWFSVFTIILHRQPNFQHHHRNIKPKFNTYHCESFLWSYDCIFFCFVFILGLSEPLKHLE